MKIKKNSCILLCCLCFLLSACGSSGATTDSIPPDGQTSFDMSENNSNSFEEDTEAPSLETNDGTDASSVNIIASGTSNDVHWEIKENGFDVLWMR